MTEETEPNPFENFESAAAIEAYIHKQSGATGLRELLAVVSADKESLERDASEIAEAGLPAVVFGSRSRCTSGECCVLPLYQG
jgi:hypothetical protein